MQSLSKSALTALKAIFVIHDIYVTVILFNFQAVTFLCFSVISVLLGAALVWLYISMIFVQEGNRWVNYDAKIAIIGMILALGILECCIGCVWVICCFSCPHAQVSRIYNNK